MDPVAMDKDRPFWHNAKVFGLAIIGAGAGYGSLFRLPYMFDRFGGGTFLVAYIACLAFIAWPLSLAELLIGQHFRKGAVGAWEQVHVKLAGLGTGSTLFSGCLCSIYFSTILSWSLVSYLGASFSSPATYVKYGLGREGLLQYFEQNALYDASSTYADSVDGGGNWPVLASVIGVWLLVLFITWRGFQSAAAAVYVVVPLPLFAICCMTIYGLSLPDAIPTLLVFLNPVSRNNGDGSIGGGANSGDSGENPVGAGFLQMDLWAHALGQSMLTLQAASGVLVAYGSYARPVHNVFKISIAVLVQSLIFAVIFAVCTGVSFAALDLSSGATTTDAGSNSSSNSDMGGKQVTAGPNQPWDPTESVVLRASRNGQSGLYVSFVLFPSLFDQMAIGNFWAVLFYGCQGLLGLQTLSAATSAIFTVLKDKFQWRKNLFLMSLICLAFAILSLVLSLRVMYPILMVIDTVIVSVVLPLFALVEAIGIGYMWSDKSIAQVVNERAGAAGCFGKCKACVVVSCHHSVNRIQEVMMEARHSVPGLITTVHPVTVKFLVPLAALVAFLSGLVSLFAYDFFDSAELLVGSLLVLLAIIVLLGGGCCRRREKQVVPLTDNDLAHVTTSDGPLGDDDFTALANFGDDAPQQHGSVMAARTLELAAVPATPHSPAPTPQSATMPYHSSYSHRRTMTPQEMVAAVLGGGGGNNSSSSVGASLTRRGLANHNHSSNGSSNGGGGGEFYPNSNSGSAGGKEAAGGFSPLYSDPGSASDGGGGNHNNNNGGGTGGSLSSLPSGGGGGGRRNHRPPPLTMTESSASSTPGGGATGGSNLLAIREDSM